MNTNQRPQGVHGSPQRNGRPGAPAKQQGSASGTAVRRPKAQSGAVRAKPRTAAPVRGATLGVNDRVLYRGSVDMVLLVIIILLVCFGAVMVFSASYASAYSEHGNSYYYILQHLRWILIGGVAMVAAMMIDVKLIRAATIPAFMVCLGLLCLVPIMGISQDAATRWIIIGPIRLQPSEPMKLALVLILALYYETFEKKASDRNKSVAAIYGFFIPAAIVAGVCVLIALESHFSGLIIMFMIGMIVMFAAGAQKKWFVIGGSAAAVLVLFAISFVDYAQQRIDMWIHPENYSTLEGIWQTVQGLNAVGSGGLFGVGLGQSTQKHLFVSEPQNDFIFSIICEELGFVGALAVVLMFVVFIIRGYMIALRAPDIFSKLTVIGIISKVGIQALLNIAVVTNMIPNTGITLPFFSYGGSAFMMLLGEMGIVLCISKYSYQKPGHTNENKPKTNRG